MTVDISDAISEVERQTIKAMEKLPDPVDPNMLLMAPHLRQPPTLGGKLQQLRELNMLLDSVLPKVERLNQLLPSIIG